MKKIIKKTINKNSINVIFYLIVFFFIFFILYIVTRPDFNILVIGQSNSTLSGQIDSKNTSFNTFPNKRIFFRNKNMPTYESAFSMQKVPLISYYFALNHFKKEGIPIKIFSGGEGSTKILNWSNKPTSKINNIFKIYDNKPDLIIWWQGESDALNTNFSEKSYLHYLNLLLEKIYVEYGEVPFIMIGLQKYEEENENWKKIRLIQKKLSRRYNHVIYVDTFDTTLMSLHPVLDYKKISKRMYEKYKLYELE